MLKYIQHLFILVLLWGGACVLTTNAGADPITLPDGDYVFPTTMEKINIEPVYNYEGLKEVPQCDLAKEKAIKNYNEYMIAFGYGAGIKFTTIGEGLFIKKAWCHYDVVNPSNFVLLAMTGTAAQIARDKENGRISSGPMFITVFDENTEIIKWSY